MGDTPMAPGRGAAPSALPLQTKWPLAATRRYRAASLLKERDEWATPPWPPGRGAAPSALPLHDLLIYGAFF